MKEVKGLKKRKDKESKNKLALREAMERNLGIVTLACKEAGLSRMTFYHYYNTDEEFRKAIDDLENYTLDWVESQLITAIKEGSEKSIHFYLKHKGKKRGWGEALDITSGGERIGEIKLVKVKKS